MTFGLLVISGVVSGIVSGMGMGGGTLLIPVLNILFSVSQIEAQGLNLISFLPMSLLALIIHFKNKLVDYKLGILFACFGVITCVLGSNLASKITTETLKKLFGGFLIFLSLFQTVLLFFQKKKQ